MANKTKSLITLIDIRQKELEKLQVMLSNEEQKRMQAVAHQQQLTKDLRREQEAAIGKPDMLAFMAQYAQDNHQRRMAFKSAQEKAEHQIEKLQEVVREIFGELKKLEIAKERIDAMEEAEAKRQEQKFMDELGMQSHRRKQADGWS